jgi:tRNA pseudouridine65 synthase
MGALWGAGLTGLYSIGFCRGCDRRSWVSDTPLHILYRDDALIAITKPAGLLVHPGREPEAKEWIAMKVLRDQIGQRVYAIHRLDRPTSGVLLLALEEPMADAMRAEFELRKVDKTYVAVVRGQPPESWENTAPLQKAEGEKWKASHTRFSRWPGARGGDLAVVKAEPLTGRHHQIRRHLASDGYPIVGDYLYGDAAENDRMAALHGHARMLLHAHTLGFRHPGSGLPVHLESPLPAAFAPFMPSRETT